MKKNQFQSNKVFCIKTPSGKVVAKPFLQQYRFRPISSSAVRASKKVQLSRIESRLHAFQQAIDEVHTLPLSPPKGRSKSKFVIFVNKNQFKSNKLCYIVVAEPFPHTLYIFWR